MNKSSFNISKGRGAKALPALCNRRKEDCNVLVNKVSQLFILILKILSIFVMRDTIKINSNDKYHHYNKTEKRNWGGVSVQVRSLIKCLSFNVSRSDRPSIINQNSIVMRDTKDDSNLSVLRKSWTVAELKVSYRQKQKTGVTIQSSYDAYKVFHEMWDKSLLNVQEQLCAIFLNHQHEVIGFRIISTGKLTSNTVDVQLLLSCALISRCSTMMIAHNHPSGNLKLSAADKQLTWHIKELSEQFDFCLLDHLILTDTHYASFADNGIIFKSN